VLALGAVGWEVGEALLESQAKHLHVDVVGKSFRHDEKEVPEDEGSEEVDDVGASGTESQCCLVDEDEEGDGCHHVKFASSQLLKDHVQQAHMQGEVHVVARTIRSR